MTLLRSHIRSIVDHDGAVILDVHNDVFYGANSTGAYIWSRLIEGEGADQIAKSLATETGTDLAIVLSDVQRFISELKDKRLYQFEGRSLENERGERI